MAIEASEHACLEHYAGLDGPELLSAVLRDYPGKVAVVSSFGGESAILLHMVSRIDPATPVIFLDTLKLFPETLAYRETLIKTLGLTDVRVILPDAAALAVADPDGTLHASDADACCHVRKTLPMERGLEGFEVVISGRKRFHGGERAALKFVSVAQGRLKVEPLAAFSAMDLKAYAAEHALPPHPLVAEGYRSIGCMPCTTRGGTDENPRAGRWAGQDKTECGIHWTHDGRMVRGPAPVQTEETVVQRSATSN